MTAKPDAATLRRSICGIEELGGFQAHGVTHVLSLVDPDLPEIEAFGRFAAHHRVILRFHDILAPRPGFVMPAEAHVGAILDFGERHARSLGVSGDHMLVHCHMGVSRSTAAMLMLMAQARPDSEEDLLLAELRSLRPQAWPNSRMIDLADALLGRGGRLRAALRRHYGVQLRTRPELGRWMADLGRQAEIDMAVDA